MPTYQPGKADTRGTAMLFPTTFLLHITIGEMRNEKQDVKDYNQPVNCLVAQIVKAIEKNSCFVISG